MKKYLLFVPIFLINITAISQTLSKVMFTGATTLASFSFITDQQAIIKISPDGNIIEWGVERQNAPVGYYEKNLMPYMGRVDYYGQESDIAFRGKVKNIGTCTITYYSSSLPVEQKGKIKSIGNLMLDYYMNYDNESYRGKLKSAGSTSISYFGSYDNEAFRGQPKSIGNTAITYYSVFDDRYNKGKIKSIGSVPFSWYNEYDRK